MKTIISPKEVIELAFGSPSQLNAGAITESTILEAQQKFIRPVMGDLYSRVESGEVDELLDGYLKPALAQYVKLLLIPSLYTSMGVMGVVQHKNSYMAPATSAQIVELKRRTRASATTLLRRAVEYIERERTRYPEYNPAKDVMKRVMIGSGVVL